MKVQIPPAVHSWPAPAVLIGCGTVSKPNLITISWIGTVSSTPPMLSISVRPSRHSFKLIQQQGEFTVNVPLLTQKQYVEVCGDKSGRDIEKFKALKLTPLPCPPLLTAPMVGETFLSLGCRLKKELPLGSHHIFIAEIVSMYCEEKYIRQDGTIDPAAESQLVWLDKSYWKLAKIK